MRLLKNMSERDRRLLVPTMIIAAFLSTLLFVDYPLYKKGKEFERKAGEEERRLRSIISMGQEYFSVKNEIDDIKDRAFTGEGSALSGIDGIVGRSGLKKKMSSLRPTTSPVADGLKRIKAELSFEKASLPEISRLVTAIESDMHPITIERVSIKATYEDPSSYNATLVVNTVGRE
jgi:hypothetical protein